MLAGAAVVHFVLARWICVALLGREWKPRIFLVYVLSLAVAIASSAIVPIYGHQPVYEQMIRDIKVMALLLVVGSTTASLICLAFRGTHCRSK